MFTHALLSALLILNASGAPEQRGGSGPAATKESLVKDALRFSNSRKLFDEVTTGYIDSLMQGLSRVNPVILDELKTALAGTFGAPSVTSTLERELSKDLDYDSLVEVKRWYETPAGRRVLEVEATERFDKNRPKKLEQFALELTRTPTPENRMKLITALEEKAQISERTLNAAAKLMITMSANILTAGTQSEEEKKAFLTQSETSFRAASGPQVRNDTFISHQYVYRSLSDEELDQYVQFLGSTTGQKYSRGVWSSLQSTLEEAATEAGRRCAEVLRKYGR